MTKSAQAKSWTLHEWSDGTHRSWAEPEFPSWYPEESGVIVEIDSGTTIASAALADNADDYGGMNPQQLAEPWSGGTLVTVGGQPYLVVYGGGHADGAYNGFLKFGPLAGAGSDSPSWSVWLAGSGSSDVVQNTGVYTSGRQAAIHSYNSVIGVGEEIYVIGSWAYYGSLGGSTGASYKFTTSGQSSIEEFPGLDDYGVAYGAGAYHDGKIYYVGGHSQFGPLFEYDIATDTWDEDESSIAYGNYVAMAIDTNRGSILVTATSGGGSAGTYWRTPMSATGRLTGLTEPTGNVYGLLYDPDRDKFVSVVSGSLTVRELDAATLHGGSAPSWTDRTFTGDTPSSASSNGVFGRFCYVPQLKGYVLVPTSTSSVYFYRA